MTPYVRYCSCQLNAAALIHRKQESDARFKEANKVRFLAVTPIQSILTVTVLVSADLLARSTYERDAHQQFYAQTSAASDPLSAPHRKGECKCGMLRSVPSHKIWFLSLRSSPTHPQIIQIIRIFRKLCLRPQNYVIRWTKGCGRKRTRTDWSGSRLTPSAMDSQRSGLLFEISWSEFPWSSVGFVSHFFLQKITFNSVTNCLGPRKFLHSGTLYKVGFSLWFILATCSKPTPCSPEILYSSMLCDSCGILRLWIFVWVAFRFFQCTVLSCNAPYVPWQMIWLIFYRISIHQWPLTPVSLEVSVHLGSWRGFWSNLGLYAVEFCCSHGKSWHGCSKSHACVDLTGLSFLHRPKAAKSWSVFSSVTSCCLRNHRGRWGQQPLFSASTSRPTLSSKCTAAWVSSSLWCPISAWRAAHFSHLAANFPEWSFGEETNGKWRWFASFPPASRGSCIQLESRLHNWEVIEFSSPFWVKVQPWMFALFQSWIQGFVGEKNWGSLQTLPGNWTEETRKSSLRWEPLVIHHHSLKWDES